MAFFLQFNPVQFLFQNSSDPEVMPNITYLLLLLETWNFNTQENLWVEKNNKDIHNLHNIQLLKKDYQLKLFPLKSNVKQSDIFRESMLLPCFLINNKHIFEGNQYYSKLMTVCSCHVTYAFQSESTLYSCLNVKELLARSRHKIWRWSDATGLKPRTT